MIDKIVKMIIESKKYNGEVDEYEKYKEKLEARVEWIDKSQIEDVKVGEKVDVRDTEHIWCVGLVELKISTLKRPPLLYIHYEGWNRKYDEYLYLTSKRLAPYGIYTKRTDIPRYYMCPQANMMYGHIIENSAQ
jgi:hypothetical protein